MSLKLTLSPSQMAKLGLKPKPLEGEPPEVKRVVTTALDKFLVRVAKPERTVIGLPEHKVLPKTAPMVEVEEPTNDSNFAFPEVIQPPVEAEIVDYEVKVTQVGETFRGTVQERHIILGIPSEEESGLINPDMELDESQVRAIDLLLNEQYGCLIGAAGTGKTTSTKALVHRLIYDKKSEFKPKRVAGTLNIAFVAFTGMAVQVIKEALPKWLHSSVMTIHMLLEFQPTESRRVVDGVEKITMPFLPARDENNPLDYDMIIIDESSMLGMDLWNQLRVACKEGTRIIMIGDLNQLPPVIGEPIFAYALSRWPVAELTHIHRQKGPGANKIVEVAHAVLSGRMFTFDKLSGNPDWRVSGAILKSKAREASKEILATLRSLMNMKLASGAPIYDAFRDRVMTAGNGFDDLRESSMVQQTAINEALALMIQPPSRDHPRYMIDAGKGQTKMFAIGNRVMALRNEAPSKKDRVTNGMTGIIKSIVANGDYAGDPHKFGSEFEYEDYIRRSFKQDMGDGDESLSSEELAAQQQAEPIDLDFVSDNLAFRLSQADADDSDALDQANRETWSSHTITIEFANGAVRDFWSKNQIEYLSLAYASTVTKCQGSQFPTAVIIVHDAVVNQLSREWLYTAITRAQSNVIILYTEFAMRVCLSRQRIAGNTLAEKILKYQNLLDGVKVGVMEKLMKKQVFLEVGPDVG